MRTSTIKDCFMCNRPISAGDCDKVNHDCSKCEYYCCECCSNKTECKDVEVKNEVKKI